MKINNFYQTLFDYAFGVKQTKLPKVRGIANKCYKYLVNKHRIQKNESNFINFSFGPNSLMINTTHRLPFTLRMHKLYSMNLVRLCEYMIHQNIKLKVLDIGANIGDTVFLITQKENFPILCIEGNPEYLELLEHNISKHPNVDLIKCFVGSNDKKENAKIVSDGYGSSYIKKENSENEIIYNSLNSILKKKPDFEDFNLIKIDTDGFDGEIIRGNIETIVKNKATIFFEYAPTFFQNGIDSELQLFKLLSENDYSRFIFYNNLGEIMFVCNSSDELSINSAHEYFSRNNRYADVIAFHKEETDLFNYVLSEENKFIKYFYKK